MYSVMDELRVRHDARQIKSLEFDSEDNTNRYGSPEHRDVIIDSEQKKTQNGVKLNLTTQELNEVYKLRYSVYVEDLKYHQPYADKISKKLRDPLDSTGNIFGIFRNNEAIGTVLTNYAKHSDLGYYSELYKMKELNYGSYYDSSITTKLIVRRDFRSKSAAFRLALATYIQALKDGIKYDFVDCDLEMVPFFVRLGYNVHIESMLHPEFGHGAVLVLELQNIEHLEECNSPFAKHYHKIMHEESVSVLDADNLEM